jgi:hypothetical protein
MMGNWDPLINKALPKTLYPLNPRNALEKVASREANMQPAVNTKVFAAAWLTTFLNCRELIDH